MRNLCFALLLFFGFASAAQAQDSIYVPDYSMANLAAWNTTTGGTISVPYLLSSGVPVTGIGNSFTVPYDVQLSGVAGSGYFVPVSVSGNDLGFRPNDVGPEPTIGAQFSAVIDVGAPPVPGAGFVFSDENIRQYFSGFTGSTSNVIAQLATPYDLIDHGQTGNYVWDVSVGGLGDTIINTPRYDSRGIYFTEGQASADPESQTFISFTAVPEPSSAVSAMFVATLLLSRRRRTVA